MQETFDIISSLRRNSILYIFFTSCWFSGFSQTSPRICTYHYSQEFMPIDGRNVPIEYYVPDGQGPFTLVFMLHGSAGAYSLRSAVEPVLDNFGEKTLARSCFAVALPHYLEAFGYRSMTSQAEMMIKFPQLLAVADTLLTHAELLPWAKRGSVFLYGESLGGYLCVALGLRRDEVRAVSEISGGGPAGYMINNPHSVAVLISHGAEDNLVPIQTALDLRQYCVHHHLKSQMNVYPKVGHYFPQAIESRCIATTIAFFLNHLHGG